MTKHPQSQNHIQATLNAALALFSAGEFEQVITLLTKVLDATSEENDEIHVLLGHAYQARGDYEAAEQAFRRALQLSPDNYEASQGLGLLLLQQQRVEEAKPYLEKCLRVHPGDILTLKAYVPVLRASGETAKAEHFLQLGWQAEPSLELAIEFTRFLINLEKLDQAIAFIDQALAALSLLPQERSRLLAEKALAYTVKEEHSKVVEVLQEALALDENFGRGWRGLAFSYLRLGMQEKALAASERALSISPRHYRNWQARADVLLAVGRVKEALDAAQRGLELSSPDDPEARPVRAVLFIQKASALAMLQRTKKSIEAFAEARNEFSKDWRFYIFPIQLLLSRGEVDEAFHILQAASAAFNLVEEQDKREALITIGIRLLYPARPEKFYRWLQSLHDVIGDNLRLLNAIGFVATGEGDLTTAEEAWKKALSLAQTSEEISITLTDLLYLYLLERNWERAHQVAKEATLLIEQIEPSQEAFLRVAFYYKGKIIPDYAPHPLRLLPVKAGFLANKVSLELAQGSIEQAQNTLEALRSLIGEASPLFQELKGTWHAVREEPSKAIAAWENALDLLSKKPDTSPQEKSMVENWIASERGIRSHE